MDSNNLKVCRLKYDDENEIGIQLSRLPWDPYPWISAVTKNSSAHNAGILTGDCLLKVNGRDIIGKRISEVASTIRENQRLDFVELQLWNPGDNCQNATQQSLSRLARSFEKISQLLECPVCLSIVKPPAWQCSHGHMICGHCKSRTQKCPICRIILGPRGRCLIADKLFSILLNVFDNKGHQKSQQKIDCS